MPLKSKEPLSTLPPWMVMGGMLFDNTNRWVSGEEMARATGISRAAVWKWVKALSQSGIPIERERGKGYRLVKTEDILHPALFLPRLKAVRGEGCWTLVPDHRFYHYLDTVDSTNTVCAKMAREGAGQGTLVVAEAQTSGRGRRGRSWYSPAGASLYLSLLLRPEMGMSESQRLTMLASVALAGVVRDLCRIDARIKWPNDLFVGRRKLAGILVEAESKGNRMDWMVLGVGLNVNTGGFPPEIEHRATSLLRETGQRWCRSTILAHFVTEVENLYRQCAGGDATELFSRWRDMSYTLGRRVKTEQGFTGYAEEVTPQGGLVIRGEGGNRIVVNAGDVDVIQEP